MDFGALTFPFQQMALRIHERIIDISENLYASDEILFGIWRVAHEFSHILQDTGESANRTGWIQEVVF